MYVDMIIILFIVFLYVDMIIVMFIVFLYIMTQRKT